MPTHRPMDKKGLTNINVVFRVLCVLPSKRISGPPPRAKEPAALNFCAETLGKPVTDTYFSEMAFDISTQNTSLPYTYQF